MLKKPQNIYLPIDRMAAKVFKIPDMAKRGEWVTNFVLSLCGEAKDEFANELIEKGRFDIYKDLMRQWRYNAKKVLDKDATDKQIHEWCMAEYGDEYLEAFEILTKNSKRIRKNLSSITAAAATREGVEESTTGCKNTDGGSAENMGQRTSEALPSPTPIKTDPKPTRKAKAEVKPEEQKYPHGEFENIMLTTREYTQLCERLDNADSLIEEADGYFEAQPDKKRKYKSHYAMLLNWDRRRKEFEAPAKVQRFKTIDDINQERIAKAKREVYEMFHKGEPKAV